MLPLAEDVSKENEKQEVVEQEDVFATVPVTVPEAVAPSVPDITAESVPARESQSAPDTTSEHEDAATAEAAKSDEDGMASSAERMTILRMVEQGKISAEDGARLLAALGKGQEAENKPRTNPFDTTRQLQVRVHDLVTNRQKVNVMLPVGLLQWAWRWLPEGAQAQLEQVQVAINSGASGRLVEVVDQDSGVRVEITLI